MPPTSPSRGCEVGLRPELSATKSVKSQAIRVRFELPASLAAV